MTCFTCRLELLRMKRQLRSTLLWWFRWKWRTQRSLPTQFYKESPRSKLRLLIWYRVCSPVQCKSNSEMYKCTLWRCMNKSYSWMIDLCISELESSTWCISFCVFIDLRNFLTCQRRWWTSWRFSKTRTLVCSTSQKGHQCTMPVRSFTSQSPSTLQYHIIVLNLVCCW